MSGKKPAKKNAGKKKSASQQKISLKKKSKQRRQAPRFKGPRRRPSARIHQGVGPMTIGHSETTPEIPDDAAEYGGES